MFLPNTLVHDLRRAGPIGVGKLGNLSGFRFPTGSATARTGLFAKITFDGFTVHPGDDVAASSTPVRPPPRRGREDAVSNTDLRSCPRTLNTARRGSDPFSGEPSMFSAGGTLGRPSGTSLAEQGCETSHLLGNPSPYWLPAALSSVPGGRPWSTWQSVRIFSLSFVSCRRLASVFAELWIAWLPLHPSLRSSQLPCLSHPPYPPLALPCPPSRWDAEPCQQVVLPLRRRVLVHRQTSIPHPPASTSQM